jgi:hypothetical protein
MLNDDLDPLPTKLRFDIPTIPRVSTEDRLIAELIVPIHRVITFDIHSFEPSFTSEYILTPVTLLTTTAYGTMLEKHITVRRRT